MDLDLKSRAAMVTGGARGIGKSIVLALAQEGANVLICDLLEDIAEETAVEARGLGVEAMPWRLDVTRLDDAYAAANVAMERFGRLDILVNNAGTIHPGKFWESTRSDWEIDIEVSLYGTLHCCRAVVPHMMAQKSGRIVNVSSGAGRVGARRNVAYVAAKAGVLGVTKALALDLAPYGIAVNAVTPSAIVSDMTVSLVEAEKKKRASMHPAALEEHDRLMSAILPLGRYGIPEDVATIVVLLASAKATRYMTGQTISIDGGSTMI